jgi:hypothetical protein
MIFRTLPTYVGEPIKIKGASTHVGKDHTSAAKPPMYDTLSEGERRIIYYKYMPTD